ncbi:MAG: 1,4-dihydroxy-2-naphthoyl-CoA synthase [Desulfobacteraceae bacterium]|jgi:naphthoate synthase|nr:MAG: 1,4-dihydroxy-2-naphthoyl-CoA synthase [Desulfobacteraceae bacterium]
MEFEDIIYSKKDGVAKIMFNRPQVYNAFRTGTLKELATALEAADLEHTVRAVILTGAGEKAFCTGGDAKEIEGGAGYAQDMDYWHTRVHQAIRTLTKPVIAAVNGYAIGGGNILVTICDMAIASENAILGQAGPKVGSFDAGFGAAYLSRLVGEKKAREIWFLCRQYNAQEALEMGLVNKVVPLDKLQDEAESWCQEICNMSPTAIKFLKQAFNADTDHMYGFENMAMSAVRLFWGSDEAAEAKRAKMEKRKPNWGTFRL